MIRGNGIDIVFVPEFEKLAGDPSCAFVRDHFTDAEIGYSERAPGTNASHLAARYAAKEAAIKAFEGAHLFRSPPFAKADYREIEILNDPWGRPYFVFHGAVAKLATKLEIAAHLSISHDGDYAVAQAVLS